MTRDSLRLDMDVAAALPISRDQTVQISLPLAFAGGYLDAYTWIIHGVMANAQTANLVLLWVHGTRYVPTRNAYEVALVSANGLDTDFSAVDVACRV